MSTNEDDDVSSEMLGMQGYDSDEDEMDWEEVVVPTSLAIQEVDQEPERLDYGEGPSNSTRPNIEITLVTKPSGKDTEKKKSTGISHAERLLRIDCHKLHTVALLANARIRNSWLNDDLLKGRLLSLTPLAIQNEFTKIHKSRVPEAIKRGHLFELAITHLAEWWANEFFQVEQEGHLRSRTFDDVQSRLHKKGLLHPPQSTSSKVDRKGKGKARQEPVGLDVEAWLDNDEEEDVEVVRSVKSLMKHALQRYGSRDVSAQLFTALCRALGIPARLVVSLQSVPWQASIGKPKPKPKPKTNGKGKEKAIPKDEDEGDDMEEVDIPSASGYLPGDGQPLNGNSSSPATKGKGKEKAKPVIKLRKSKSKGQTLVSSRPPRPPDPTQIPPVFWTEVFSRADARWLPVDPIRAIVNKRKLFDPGHPSIVALTTGKRPIRVDNRMSYVVAFEEDNYARDLTPRYAREYGAKVAKAQVGGKGRKEWWESVMGAVTRPYRLHRDDLEDEELVNHQITEPMPTTMAGFKDHPLYVLARHLLRDQEIRANTPELGKFRGEPVYPRSAVLSLKTAETWMRKGRVVREGEQPMKWVKQRAVTVGRKRELEVLKEAGSGGLTEGKGEGEEIMQGLYAERQTEEYVPDPVIDGRIPKNDFGNIDLYTHNMLPAGAAHIPHKGAAKVARQLGFDYAEAVTGFEFKKRRAFPVITGIVVAMENEEAVLEAYWEQEQAAAEKAKTKRHDAVIKRWIRLIQGLRVRKRLQEQYAGRPDNPVANGHHENGEEGEDQAAIQAGGFITGADDVVQAYSLPKYQHAVFRSASNSRRSTPIGSTTPSATAAKPVPIVQLTEGSREEDDDNMMKGIIPTLSSPPPPPRGAPMTMAELAAGHAALLDAGSPRSPDVDDSLDPGSAPQADDHHDGHPSDLSPEQTLSARRSRRSNDMDARSTAPRSTESPSGRGRKRGRGVRINPGVDVEEATQEAENGTEPSPAKRRKPAPPVVKSDRVLRTRRGKDVVKLQEEREQEAALREAIGGSDSEGG